MGSPVRVELDAADLLLALELLAHLAYTDARSPVPALENQRRSVMPGRKFFPTTETHADKRVLRNDISNLCASRSAIGGELSLPSCSQFAISMPGCGISLHIEDKRLNIDKLP
jgi:hypothetical protein